MLWKKTSEDLGTLKQIEHKIGQRLKQVSSKVRDTRINGYVLNDKNDVVKLFLCGHDLTIPPDEIFRLKNLNTLSLIRNNILQLPEELVNLKNLVNLFLGNNRLSRFPMEICRLPNLERLGLAYNRVKHLPKEIEKLGELQNLKELHLVSNLLTDIPQEISKLNLEIKWEWDPTRRGIYLANNPLEFPPIEIVKQGRNAVVEYFESLKVGRQALNEVKVLLVGNGGAGKTSLVKQLLGEEFDPCESQTHGINIRDWNIETGNKTIYIHFWDFGGQEIMHATHQFFLSKRSLYILVLDGRKEEDAEYWLKHVESFGGSSPILVVLNKIDQAPGFDVNRKFLQDKYKGIKGFYKISCAQATGIRDFCDDLKRILAKMKILKTTWAKTWFNVKTQLEAMKESFISYTDYKAICEKNDITEPSSQETLVDFLHDLGVVLHFRDFELLDTHVLEPKWVTNAVYKILNSEELSQCKGVLQLSLLDEILNKKEDMGYIYPPDKFRFIIDLMIKFELCYEIDNQTVLIPNLLEIQEPFFDFDYADSLKFLLEYDFLPKSVLPRFIIKMHKDIKADFRWRTGVVLEDIGFHSTALIKADERDRKIYIYVCGEQKRDYFSTIRKIFKDIDRSFEKLTVTELVPLPDNEDVAVEYNELIGHELSGRDEIFIGKLRKSYSVTMLLNGIEKEYDLGIMS